MPPPNIVVICADDLGFNEIGAYQGKGFPDRDVFGGARVHTPHIDSLARDGALFTRHYTTGSVCTPSRYSLLTGRYASRAPEFLAKNPPGQAACVGWNTPISPAEGTIGTVMKSLGYATGFVGKWHNGEPHVDVTEIKSITDPFDPRVSSVARAAQETRQNYLRHGFGFDFVERVYFGDREGFPAALQVHNLEWLAEGAEKFITASRNRPFYLHLAFSTPHGDYPVDFTAQDPRITPAGVLDKAPSSRMPPRAKLLERLRAAGVAGHTAMSAWQDECVGAVLACLEEQGLAQNTVVIFTGDHLSRGKYTCYEGCHVPFLMRWPDALEPGRQIGALTAHLDLVATCAEIGGGKPPAGYRTDGASFAPLVDARMRAGAAAEASSGGGVPWRKQLLLEISNLRGLVTERWKYIACRAPQAVLEAMEQDRVEAAAAGRGRWTGWDGRKNPHRQAATEGVRYFDAGRFEHYFDADQLYDLNADVFETRNLFHVPEHAEVGARLQRALSEELGKLPHAFGEFTMGK